MYYDIICLVFHVCYSQQPNNRYDDNNSGDVCWTLNKIPIGIEKKEKCIYIRLCLAGAYKIFAESCADKKLWSFISIRNDPPPFA